MADELKDNPIETPKEPKTPDTTVIKEKKEKPEQKTEITDHKKILEEVDVEDEEKRPRYITVKYYPGPAYGREMEEQSNKNLVYLLESNYEIISASVIPEYYILYILKRVKKAEK